MFMLAIDCNDDNESEQMTNFVVDVSEIYFSERLRLLVLGGRGRGRGRELVSEKMIAPCITAHIYSTIRT